MGTGHDCDQNLIADNRHKGAKLYPSWESYAIVKTRVSRNIHLSNAQFLQIQSPSFSKNRVPHCLNVVMGVRATLFIANHGSEPRRSKQTTGAILHTTAVN